LKNKLLEGSIQELRDQTLKCSFFLLFLIAIKAGIAEVASPLPTFTSYNLNATGYIINGTICNKLFGGPPSTCGPSTLVIDPENNQMAFLLYDNGGNFIVKENTSFIYGQPLLPNCTEVAGWTFATQVFAYSHSTSISGSTDPGNSQFVGECGDVGACLHSLTLYLDVRNNIVLLLRFDQKVSLPFGPNGTSVCVLVQGEINYDIGTLDTNPAHRAPYFVLTAGCSTPSDYCSQAYPAGNPCAIPQKKRFMPQVRESASKRSVA